MKGNQKWPSYCETYEMNFHRRWKGDDGLYFGYRFWFHCLCEQNGLFFFFFFEAFFTPMAFLEYVHTIPIPLLMTTVNVQHLPFVVVNLKYRWRGRGWRGPISMHWNVLLCSRKLKATIDEYTTRVGQQAVVLCCTPGRPSNQSSSTFKVFGSQPLETVVSCDSCLVIHFYGINKLLGN